MGYRIPLPSNRRPTTPGEMPAGEFLKPLGVSLLRFAKHIGVTYARLNEIVNDKRAVTPDTALRFFACARDVGRVLARLATLRGPLGCPTFTCGKRIAKIKRLSELARAS
jgi:addiction module HigA family antidote